MNTVAILKMRMPRTQLSMKRVVNAFWHLLVMGINISGTVLELTSPGRTPINTSQYGVDVSRCYSLTFQLKSCWGAHVWLGDGTGGGSYEVAIGVGNKNVTELRACHICCTPPIQRSPTAAILDCSTFRTFWLSWGQKQLSFGHGNAPNTNCIFATHDAARHEISTFAFMGWTNRPSVVILGDTNMSRFELVSEDAMYSDTPMVETVDSLLNCIIGCHFHDNCGMFSYNKDQDACALFDRMHSSFEMKEEAGWKSWKMRYC